VAPGNIKRIGKKKWRMAEFNSMNPKWFGKFVEPRNRVVTSRRLEAVNVEVFL
jgi:hypothetical protein